MGASTEASEREVDEEILGSLFPNAIPLLGTRHASQDRKGTLQTSRDGTEICDFCEF
jgi:hypothetical protein